MKSNTLQEQLINGVAAEAEHATIGDFPLDVFPEKVKHILLDWVRNDYFRIEYAAASMLSAAASAIGNSYHLHIRGKWNVPPALYMILVGRPGMGKTPPLKAAYAPI